MIWLLVSGKRGKHMVIEIQSKARKSLLGDRAVGCSVDTGN